MVRVEYAWNANDDFVNVLQLSLLCNKANRRHYRPSPLVSMTKFPAMDENFASVSPVQ
jgi:hypothetical protein